MHPLRNRIKNLEVDTRGSGRGYNVMSRWVGGIFFWKSVVRIPSVC